MAAASRGEDYPIYSQRLERDGWALLQSSEHRYVRGRIETMQPEVWRKSDRSGKWMLTSKQRHRNDPHGPWYDMTYEVSAAGGKTEPAGIAADWADWDQSNRLVATREAGLYAIKLRARREPEWELLADFTADKPASVETPAWAACW